MEIMKRCEAAAMKRDAVADGDDNHDDHDRSCEERPAAKQDGYQDPLLCYHCQCHPERRLNYSISN